MTRPKIVGSSERMVQEKAPPESERIKPHKWLSSASLEKYRESESSGFDLYLSKLAEEKIRNHAMSRLDPRMEIMGLLLGTMYKHREREYVLVRDVVTTDLDASLVSVRFDRQGFEKLFESLDDSGFDYVIVGWYHSHPGHGCFLSQTDVDTQVSMFNRPFHSALVIDPVNMEIETFKVENGRSMHRPFAVYWDEFQNPYFGESVRKRRLKE
jgi:26S proteasome regulatory subunit N11